MTTIRSLVLGLMTFASTAVALPVAAHAYDRDEVIVVHRHREPVHAVGNAFRTAGRGVVYGAHTVGRTLTGHRTTYEGRVAQHEDRARIREHARETRSDFRGY